MMLNYDYVNTGGDLTNNTPFMENIPKTELSNKIIAKAQNGTTMVNFGNGSQPHVMIQLEFMDQSYHHRLQQ